MENDILDSLNDLGYEGPFVEESVFTKAIEAGPKSLDYTKLVHILSEELKKLCNLEETIHMMNDPDDSSSFLLELSSFLKELGCPYKKLTTGHMSSRLQTKEDRLLLLDYLISELMAARMVQVDCPKEKQTGMEIVVQESPTAKDLKDILVALKFNKPPPNITVEMLFSKLEAKLKETIQKEGDKLVGKPLYNKALSEKDWKNLETTFNEMYEEYRLRRETLITRLECTIQSFEWSDRLKSKKDQIQSAYRPKREFLKPKPNVKLSDFLAARTSLLQVEKTSSASVRKNTQSEVNKVMIGNVPDRGGRPNEQQPPPPEMPSWQQRSTQNSAGGPGRGGRGGFGGGRGERGGGAGRGGDGGRGGARGGGRVQGGYNQTQGRGDQRQQASPAPFNQNRNYQTYEVPPGGYNQNQGGYNQNQGGYNQTYGSSGGYNQNQGGYNQNQGYGGGGYSQDECETFQQNQKRINEKILAKRLKKKRKKERRALARSLADKPFSLGALRPNNPKQKQVQSMTDSSRFEPLTDKILSLDLSFFDEDSIVNILSNFDPDSHYNDEPIDPNRPSTSASNLNTSKATGLNKRKQNELPTSTKRPCIETVIDLSSDTEPEIDDPIHIEPPIDVVSLIEPSIDDSSLIKSSIKSSIDDPSLVKPSVDDMTYIEPPIDVALLIEHSIDDKTLIEQSIDDTPLIKETVDDPSIIKPSIDDTTLIEPAIVDLTLIQPSGDDPLLIKPLIDDTKLIEPSIDDPILIEQPIDVESHKEPSCDDPLEPKHLNTSSFKTSPPQNPKQNTQTVTKKIQCSKTRRRNRWNKKKRKAPKNKLINKTESSTQEEKQKTILNEVYKEEPLSPQPSTSNIGPNTNLGLAITSKNTNFITKNESEFVLSELDKILMKLMREYDGTGPPGPTFAGKPVFSGGNLKLWCVNQHTVDWLTTYVNEITLPTNEKLKVVPISELSETKRNVRCFVILPGLHKDIRSVIDVLAYQNRWAQVSRWIPNGLIPKPPNTLLLVSVPKDLVSVLVENEKRLNFRFGSVYIIIKNARSKQ